MGIASTEWCQWRCHSSELYLPAGVISLCVYEDLLQEFPRTECSTSSKPKVRISKLLASIRLASINGTLVKNDNNIASNELVKYKIKDGYYDIPNNWCWVKLPDVIELQQGVQVGIEHQKEKEFDNSIRFLRIINFTQDMNDMRWVDKKFSNTKSLISSSDLVMVRYGATAGKIFYGVDGLLANNLFIIKLKNEKLIDKDIQVFPILNQYRCEHLMTPELVYFHQLNFLIVQNCHFFQYQI